VGIKMPKIAGLVRMRCLLSDFSRSVHGDREKNLCDAVIHSLTEGVVRPELLTLPQVNDMKASVMKKLNSAHQGPKDESTQRFSFAQDKGHKLEPFHIAAIGSDRRSLARAMKFDQRR
jgi:hypothetical protein